MFWFILLIISFMILIYLFQSIFFKYITSGSFVREEYFNNSNNNWNIKRTLIPEFNIDNYIIYDNQQKELYKTEGKWNLEQTDLHLTDGKNKIHIIHHDNIYKFTYNIITLINK